MISASRDITAEQAGKPLPSGTGGVTPASEVAANDLFAAIMDEGEMLASHAVSLREAAFRSDRALVRLHAVEARAALLKALSALRSIEALPL